MLEFARFHARLCLTLLTQMSDFAATLAVHSPMLGVAFAAALLACARANPQRPLPPAARIAAVKVADFPGYTEGIAFDERGAAYVSAGRNP